MVPTHSQWAQLVWRLAMVILRIGLLAEGLAVRNKLLGPGGGSVTAMPRSPITHSLGDQ